MRVWVCLCACVALVVGQRQPQGNIGNGLRLGLLATTLGVPPVPGGQTNPGGQTGKQVCFCLPVNQFCFSEISSRAGPDSSTLEVSTRNNFNVNTRIVNKPVSGECDVGIKCCYIDGSETHTTARPTGSQKSCGFQNPQPYRQAGNAEATFGEYPWMAILLDSADKYKGGGVLIAENWVLTAAHKIHQERSLKVRLGDLDVRSPQDHPTLRHIEVPVQRIIVHPDFNANNLQSDLALLQLQQPVNTQLYPHIGTACLPEQRQLFEGERKCWVTGYGQDAFTNSQFQRYLKEVDVPIVDPAVCQARLRQTKLGKGFVLDNSFVCAGGIAGKDACTGDGGAPLVCNVGQGWTVVGLVAWGIGCAQQDVPGVYVNVPNFRNYIRDITGI